MTNIPNKILKIYYPNPLSIFFGLAGTLFFAFIANLTYNSQFTVINKIDTNIEKIIFYSIFGIFIILSIWSLILILKTKIVTLTNQSLIIKQPLLFFKQVIPLKSIIEITEQDFNINPKVKYTTYKIHNGQQCNLELNNGKNIKLNSFEILEYEELIKKIQIARNRAPENSNSIKNEGWGILIIIILITIGLIIATIFK